MQYGTLVFHVKAGWLICPSTGTVFSAGNWLGMLINRMCEKRWTPSTHSLCKIIRAQNSQYCFEMRDRKYYVNICFVFIFFDHVHCATFPFWCVASFTVASVSLYSGKNWWKKLCLLPSKILSKLFPFLPHIREKMPFMKNHYCKYKPNLGKTFIMEKMKNNIQNWKQKELLAWWYSIHFRFQTSFQKIMVIFGMCKLNGFLPRWLFDPRFIKLMLVSR